MNSTMTGLTRPTRNDFGSPFATEAGVLQPSRMYPERGSRHLTSPM